MNLTEIPVSEIFLPEFFQTHGMRRSVYEMAFKKF